MIFDDESMLQGCSSEGTSTRDDLEVNSLRDSEMMENSQPESQVTGQPLIFFLLAVSMATDIC